MTMLEMIKAVDLICKKEAIPYWLTDGTLLGSERHKGFIPWDDDADIAMLRDDYNRFKKVIDGQLPEKFKVETEMVHTHGKHNWLKILYLGDFEWLDWHGITRQGISIDIFPFDYVPVKNKITVREKLVHRVASIKYPPEAKGIKNKIRRSIYSSQLQNLYSRLNPKSDYITYGIETPYFGFAYFQLKDIFPLQQGIFEGEYLNIPFQPSHYLSTLYGEDFMKIPEEGKRQSHMADLKFITK